MNPKSCLPGLTLLLSLLFASVALAAPIVQVVPFATENSLRVVTRVSGAPAGQVSATGEIVSLPDRQKLWSGSLGDGKIGGDTGEIEKKINDLKPKLWSTGSPNLYELAVTVRASDKVIDTQKCRIGFRSFSYKDGHFLLNGKPIFLRGLAINPPGRGEPKELGHSRQFAYDYVKYMRGQNLNLIRPSEADQDWYDAADEMGMLVYAGFYGSPPTGLTKEEEAQQKLENQDEAEGKRLPKDFERSMAAYKKEFETFARHPSIIIYILTNEMPYKGKTGELVHEFLTKAYEHLSKWDRTRLFIGNAGYGEGHEGDLNDVHRYWGWYYNSFTTYFNLRDPKLFGDYEKNQPFTFSECVGNFTGPTGAYNYIERKQLAAALGWSGTKPDQPKEAQGYQAFMVKQATESFRRMREQNTRMAGLMPFTITMHNWRGITSFAQMKPTAASEQFGISYQPVLLSWEHWQPNVYAGSKTPIFAHVINDADDFSDLSGAKLVYELRGKGGKSIQSGQIDIPKIAYYGTWRELINFEIPKTAATGEYTLHGEVRNGSKVISKNDTPIFIAAEWKDEKAQSKRKVFVIDHEGRTAKALEKIGIDSSPAKDVAKLDATKDTLVIGEEAWTKSLDASKKQLQEFVRAGGRVLCLGQKHDQFDTSWLPGGIKLADRSVNEPEYMTPERPAYDQTHVNLERPDHPAFKDLDRDRFELWSDYTNWDQSKKGFPRISPMRFGYKLTNADDLSKVAILADYDRGLEGIAVAELFDGKGSVLLTGLDIVGRSGLDPVADRVLANLVSYMAGNEAHAKYPLVKNTIKWGDFQTECGVISGPLSGFFRNTEWLVPPTEPNATPITKAQGAWNTKPGDQFVPHGIRPRGVYTYSFNCAPKDADKNGKSGTGIFFATIPSGRRNVVSVVRNPTKSPVTIHVEVNGKQGEATPIAPDKTVTIRSAIPSDTTDVGVRYTGDKELVIEETSFQ